MTSQRTTKQQSRAEQIRLILDFPTGMHISSDFQKRKKKKSKSFLKEAQYCLSAKTPHQALGGICGIPNLPAKHQSINQRKPGDKREAFMPKSPLSFLP